MTERAPLSREEKSWVLYDAANSAFVLVMITAIMPIYFKDVAAKGVADAVATSNWAFANSTASLILALLAPVLGTMADYKDRKKPFFLFFLFTGLVFTVALTVPLEGDDVGGQAVDEPAVVGDHHRCAGEGQQGLFQCTQGFHVQVVGGFVQ